VHYAGTIKHLPYLQHCGFSEQVGMAGASDAMRRVKKGNGFFLNKIIRPLVFLRAFSAKRG
jgi:hypothetical protein